MQTQAKPRGAIIIAGGNPRALPACVEALQRYTSERPDLASQLKVSIAEDGWGFACEDVRYPLGRIQDFGYSLGKLLAGGAARRFRLGIRGCRRCVRPCGVLARMVTDPSVLVHSASSALARRAGPRRMVASFGANAGDCRTEDI